MPRIPDFVQESAAYLYPDGNRARVGEGFGGSAFLVRHHAPGDTKRAQLYAVTNAHVIEGGHRSLRLTIEPGTMAIVDTPESDWSFHRKGDDLAACPVPLAPEQFKHDLLTPAMFADKAILAQFNIGLGDDCFAVGRAISHEGKQRDLPSLRFGNLAQMPGEPVMQARPNGYFAQESYLVEGRAILGISGTPVFVHILPGIPRPDRPLVDARRWHGPWLLGVTWGCIRGEKAPVQRRDAKGQLHATEMVADNVSGMTAVIPAWKLAELLHDVAPPGDV